MNYSDKVTIIVAAMIQNGAWAHAPVNELVSQAMTIVDVIDSKDDIKQRV